MKWALCGLLWLGCAAGGMVLAHGLSQRVNALVAAQQGFLQLRTHLAYAQCLLEQAVAWAGEQQGGFVGQAFTRAAQSLARGEAAESAFEGAFSEAGVPLNAQDVSRIKLAASQFGGHERQQRDGFEALESYWDNEIVKAKQLHKERAKLYRSSGMLAGALLIVLFI